MNRVGHLRYVGVVIACVALLVAARQPSAQSVPSSTPDHPFKLATFEAGGKVRVGLVLGARVLDIEGANAFLTKQASLSAVAIPSEMRTLIEQYDTVKGRLYQIANYFTATPPANQPFAFEFDKVAVKAPIKYPWNMLAAAANYKAHAEGMGGTSAPPAAPAPAAPAKPAAPAPAGFDATAAARIVPSRDAPIMFAKSPRSCIIDPGEPFYIVDGRARTDYEAEMVVVMGPRPP
jgi:2-keto-4-pentenoate hydratase/2-oxohepta-3-ene-1,7-dioic acid hydratase in catechol pathway